MLQIEPRGNPLPPDYEGKLRTVGKIAAIQAPTGLLTVLPAILTPGILAGRFLDCKYCANISRVGMMASRVRNGRPVWSCDIIIRMPSSSTFQTHAFQTDDPRLQSIYDKVMARERLDAADALALYRTGDILAVGWMANSVRERMHGDKTYFNVNRHINPTNVCVAACRLCAFGRKKDAPGAYTMALEEAFETAASGYSEAVTEFHIVGGLHPDLPFQYFLDLCSGLKQRFPQVHLKAFTMVEVAYLSKRAKLSIRETLEQLKASGVDSLPGGGAEIFADRVRHIICDHKIDGDQWPRKPPAWPTRSD